MRERLFSTSSFQLGGTVWSCPQLTVIYPCILCSAACANRRKVVCIWTPDFLSTIALIPREKQRRNIAIVAKKQNTFPNGIYFAYMLWSTNVWKHTLEQGIKFEQAKSHPTSTLKLAHQCLLLPINCTACEYIF